MFSHLISKGSEEALLPQPQEFCNPFETHWECIPWDIVLHSSNRGFEPNNIFPRVICGSQCKKDFGLEKMVIEGHQRVEACDWLVYLEYGCLSCLRWFWECIIFACHHKCMGNILYLRRLHWWFHGFPYALIEFGDEPLSNRPVLRGGFWVHEHHRPQFCEKYMDTKWWRCRYDIRFGQSRLPSWGYCRSS